MGLNAIGAFIFGGSQTIGHLQSGWTVDKVLEMTDNMTEINAYHFEKNYPNIPIIKPSEWSSDSFLESLKNNQYDLLFANNPCSGLSAINRNANVNQPINNKFFEVFDIIKRVQPKAFLIENAPTLVTIGTPILQEMTKIIGDKYKFTIVRDMAGNHGVAMKRMRTFIIGWNKEYFNNRIPLLHMNLKKQATIGDVIGIIDENTLNVEYDTNRQYSNLVQYYNLIKPNSSVLRMCVDNFEIVKNSLNKSQLKAVDTINKKRAENKNIWDKSPWRLSNDKHCGSITSISCYIHPTEDRDLYIREYARIMGYPDDFKFYPNECKCSTMQCIAQGVPVNFIKYISKEIKRCFESDYKYIEDANLIYQNHVKKGYFKFTIDEFNKLIKLNDVNLNMINLER